jgi:hypothetical protein
MRANTAAPALAQAPRYGVALKGFEQTAENGGGIPLEHCTATDDGRACALEYNVVRWGRGDSGKLAVARVYHDSDPPLTPHA